MASAPPQELPTTSGELGGFWRPPGGQPGPLLPHFPSPYPALPCYGLLHAPPLGLLARPVSAPYELPGGRPLLWPGPLLYAPLVQPGPPEDRSRAKAATMRESTAALKAWLGRHRKNPYPSKGEKVLLAIVSRMSLTQVSTWFANARRRLKKENRACWPPRPPKDGEGEEEEEDDGEEGGSEGETGEGEAAAPSTTRHRKKPPSLSGLEAAPATPWLKAQQGHGLPSPATGTGTAESLPPKPKIWRVAEFATRPQPGRPAV